MGQAAGLIGALLLLTAAAPEAAASDFTLTVAHGGLTRTALVHAPAGFAGPRPVVINFHGGGGAADSHRAGRAWTPPRVVDANEEIWRFFARFSR